MNAARQKIFLSVLTLLLLAGTAAALTWLKAHQRLGAPGLVATPVPGSVMMKLELPERVLDFTSTNLPEPEVVLGYLPKDTSFVSRRYVAADGAWAMANVILMGADRTSIHKPDYCLAGQGWDVHSKETVKIPIVGANPYELAVSKWVLSQQVQTPDGQKRTVGAIYVYWFVADGEETPSHNQFMRWLALDLLSKAVWQRWAYVSYFSVCEPGQEDATFARMGKVIAASVPEFQQPPGGR